MKAQLSTKDVMEFIEDEIEFMFESLSDNIKWYNNETDPRLNKLQPAKILLTNVWKQFVEMEMT